MDPHELNRLRLMQSQQNLEALQRLLQRAPSLGSYCGPMLGEFIGAYRSPVTTAGHIPLAAYQAYMQRGLVEARCTWGKVVVGRPPRGGEARRCPPPRPWWKRVVRR